MALIWALITFKLDSMPKTFFVAVNNKDDKCRDENEKNDPSEIIIVEGWDYPSECWVVRVYWIFGNIRRKVDIPL